MEILEWGKQHRQLLDTKNKAMTIWNNIKQNGLCNPGFFFLSNYQKIYKDFKICEI